MIEITFATTGNTIMGNYTTYFSLDKAMKAKKTFVPYGLTLTADSVADLDRLTEYVTLFGHCIKTLKAFQKACSLAGVTIKAHPNR